MRILYLSMSLSLNSNNLYSDLVRGLQKKGHSITILKSEPYISKTQVIDESDNLKIININTGNQFVKNPIKKGINQILLPYYFKKAIQKYLMNENFDLILYATPPITLVKIVEFCKKHYNAKTFLMLKDIFPQNAVDLELIKKNGLIYKYFRNEEKKYYKVSDSIGCMSPGNKKFLLENNSIDKNKIVIFPNSIEISEITKTKFNEFKTTFIFGGNLGKPQNIDFILSISKVLNYYDKAEFLIIGNGTEKYKIEDFIKKFKPSNLFYINYLPQKEYEEKLMSADVGLISLDPRFTIPNIPSKLQVYLKLNKPVLAITDETTDIREIILENDCGWWTNSSDIQQAAKVIKDICENKKSQIEKGYNGYKCLKEYFDIESNIKILENIIRN